MREKKVTSYNIVLESEASTVVAEYNPIEQKRNSYQSESELENMMIEELEAQGYELLNINSNEALILNLRQSLEELNNFKFTDKEWERFFKHNIAKNGDDIKAKSRIIQQDYIQVLKRDDGSSFNVKLIEKKHIHKNKLQVIHQYEAQGNYKNRYDVTILVNGLPLVHCELKRRGVAIKEAFNQIERYQRESFWADSGLFEYIQIFVISNGTITKYYSNSTRFNVVEEHNGKRKANKIGSASFDFTNYWADAQNNTILDLVDFTKTFFAKHTILKILTSFCVFTTNETLLVMRPYQIAATERILNQIKIAENYKKWGTINAGGFIWHTTGSGKTLTSFKTAQLASSLDYIDKVMFVVDRQDLDYQTMCEYDRFEKGAANASRNTEKLNQNLEDDTKKIVVTTIQKLHSLIKKYKEHKIYAKKCVIIFDECHRSQFGDMHLDITRKFKKYALFGFTGTPIFATNANTNVSGGRISDASMAFTKRESKACLKTTQQAFGQRLHTYTVVNAINDKNVLPFKVDYVNTIKDNKGDGTLIEAIDNEKLVIAPKRVQGIVSYILEHYDQKTLKAGPFFDFNVISDVSKCVKNFNKEIKSGIGGEKTKSEVRKRQGFNSIFAVSSIKAAKVFYEEFKKQIAKDPKHKSLKIALIYSYGVNEDNQGSDYVMEEDSDSAESLNVDDRAFLDNAIKDYNQFFNTQYDTSSQLFSSYYKDLSLRVKNGEVDILIVVNMFLTGFDATGLNTLWCDKDLKQHGLIQAFSRTNRILNSVKNYGNIVCFRNLRQQVDDAIALFGDKDAKGIVILRNYEEYYNGYHDGNKAHKGYKELLNELYEKYPLPVKVVGEKAKKDFISLFGAILRLLNILRSFDDFSGNEIFTEADLQDYLSFYGELYEEFKGTVVKDDVTDDVVFEMELVKQIVVDIDYILALIKMYHDKHTMNKDVPSEISRAIASNPELRPKKELIEAFIQSLNADSDVMNDWEDFKKEKKETELKELIKEEKLKEDKARNLIERVFRLGECSPSDNDISEILPPISRFAKGNPRGETKLRVLDKIKAFFMKYI